MTAAHTSSRVVRLAAIVAIAGLGGCGSDRESVFDAATVAPPPASNQPQVTTPAPATQTGTTTPAPATQTGTTRQPAAAAPKAAPRPKPKPAPDVAIVADRNVSGAVPLKCLRRAGLRKAAKRAPGLWAGTFGEDREVVVDGPYERASGARTSAKSLEGVSIAEAGGRYVASAALRSRAEQRVHEVALCLRAGARG